MAAGTVIGLSTGLGAGCEIILSTLSTDLNEHEHSIFWHW